MQNVLIDDRRIWVDLYVPPSLSLQPLLLLTTHPTAPNPSPASTTAGQTTSNAAPVPVSVLVSNAKDTKPTPVVTISSKLVVTETIKIRMVGVIGMGWYLTFLIGVEEVEIRRGGRGVGRREGGVGVREMTGIGIGIVSGIGIVGGIETETGRERGDGDTASTGWY